MGFLPIEPPSSEVDFWVSWQQREDKPGRGLTITTDYWGLNIYIHIYIYTYLYLMYQFSIDYAKSCGFVCVLTMILIVTNCKQVKHVQRFTTVQ
jgi:hypothetical protein